MHKRNRIAHIESAIEQIIRFAKHFIDKIAELFSNRMRVYKSGFFFNLRQSLIYANIFFHLQKKFDMYSTFFSSDVTCILVIISVIV